jgi:hypothetical protein
VNPGEGKRPRRLIHPGRVRAFVAFFVGRFFVFIKRKVSLKNRQIFHGI